MKPFNNLPAKVSRPGACQSPACGSSHAGHAAGQNARQTNRQAIAQPAMPGRKAAPVNPAARLASSPAQTRGGAQGNRPQNPGAAQARGGTAVRPGHMNTPQRLDNRASSVINRQSAAPASSTAAAAKAPNYVFHPPSPLGGGRQQIKVTIKGSQQIAGSVDIRPSGAGKVYISDLKVEKQYRRRGLANQLMSAAMTTARSQGFSGARLEARPSDMGISPQALVSMYQRLGFKNVGKTGRGNPLMERRL